MKKRKFILLLSAIVMTTSCQSTTRKDNGQTLTEAPTESIGQSQNSDQDLSRYSTAYFASGCFWCTEAIFESLKGVKEVVSGYSGGTTPDPTYEKVGSGTTGYAESVKIYYDPKVISFGQLIEVSFGSQDPTTPDRQGPDEGTQYRSIAFYQNDTEKKSIEDYIAKLKKEKVFGKKPIVTEVTKFTKFYDAEAYHQGYEKKHPDNPYVQSVSIPRINRFKEKFPQLLKKDIH